MISSKLRLLTTFFYDYYHLCSLGNSIYSQKQDEGNTLFFQIPWTINFLF